MIRQFLKKIEYMHYRGFFRNAKILPHHVPKKFKTHGNALNTPNRLSVIASNSDELSQELPETGNMTKPNEL